MVGPEDEIAKAAAPAATKERKPKVVSVDLPGEHVPVDQALRTWPGFRRSRSKLTVEETRRRPRSPRPSPMRRPEPEDAALAAIKATEAAVYKRDIDTATRRRLLLASGTCAAEPVLSDREPRGRDEQRPGWRSVGTGT